jgi:hypothetical protein
LVAGMLIGQPSRDPVIIRDEMHYTMMERGSIRLAAAIKLAQHGKAPKPANDMMWLMPFKGGANHRPAAPSAMLDYRHRDPCTFCGTRADIGCKHRRAA